jgi:hypothetical protein
MNERREEKIEDGRWGIEEDFDTGASSSFILHPSSFYL